MATGPVAEAFVEIHPRFDAFDRELDRGIARALADVENRANRAFAGVEAAAESAASAIASAFEDAEDDSRADLEAIADGAESAFDTVDDAVLEAVRTIENSLNGLSDGQPFAPIATDAERAGEQAEDALREIGNEGERQFDRIEREANDASNNIGTSIRRAAGIAATAFVGVQIGQAFVGAVEDVVAFEASVNEVATLLTSDQLAAGALDTVKATVDVLATSFGTLSTESVPAVYQALSSGVPADNILDFLVTANKAAVGGAIELETAVDGISSVVNAYGADIIDAATASDLMFTTVRLGKTTFDELSASLFQVNPVAAALGVGFDDVSAALAALTVQGVPTSVAATQIRGALAELGKEGTVASDAFAELAGKSFTEFIAAGGSLVDAFDIISTGAADSGKSVLDLFGSVEAGQAVLALGGNPAFAEALAQMGEAAGATDGAFNKFVDGAGFNLQRLQAEFERVKLGALEELGPTLALLFAPVFELLQAITPAIEVLGSALAELVGFLVPVIAKIITALAPVIEMLGVALVDALEQIAPLVPEIADAFAELLTALIPLLPIFVELAVDILKPLIPVLPILVDGLVVLINVLVDVLDVIEPILPVLAAFAAAAFLLANPLTAIVIGATLLIGVLDDLLDALGGFSGLASIIGGFFADLGGVIGRFVTDTLPKIVGFFVNLHLEILGALASLGADLIGLFGSAFLDLVTFLPLAFLDVVTAIAGLHLAILAALATLGADLLGIFTDAFLGVISAIPGFIAQIVGFYLALPGQVVAALASFGGMLFDTFTAAFAVALGAVTTGIDNIVSGITGFIAAVPGYAGQVLGAMTRFGKNILQGIVDGVGNAAGFAADIASTISRAVRGVINRILRAIARPINIALDIMDKAAGPFVNFPEVSFPELALGGIFDSPLFAKIAEAGREVVIPLTNPRRAVALVEQSGLLDILDKFHFGRDLSTNVAPTPLGAALASAGAGVVLNGGINVRVVVETTGGVSEGDAAMLADVITSRVQEAFVERQALVDARINRGGKA